MGIKIYTIAFGPAGSAPVPFRKPFTESSRSMGRLDATCTCNKIATATGGKYFGATDT